MAPGPLSSAIVCAGIGLGYEHEDVSAAGSVDTTDGINGGESVRAGGVVEEEEER